jgi:hypothetical protein
LFNRVEEIEVNGIGVIVKADRVGRPARQKTAMTPSTGPPPYPRGQDNDFGKSAIELAFQFAVALIDVNQDSRRAWIATPKPI